MGQNRVFLIQNMFPCIEKYISGKYLDINLNDTVLEEHIKRHIQKNAREVLKLHKKGVNIIFPNVLEIEKKLIEELQKENN